MFRAGEQQLILADSIGVHTIGGDDVLFWVDACVVAQRQGPVVVWSDEGPPNTVRYGIVSITHLVGQESEGWEVPMC